jgi:hypothetical protein
MAPSFRRITLETDPRRPYPFWLIFEPDRLSKRTSDLLDDAQSDLFFSRATLWELSSKMSRSRLPMPGNSIRFLLEQIERLGITILPRISLPATHPAALRQDRPLAPHPRRLAQLRDRIPLRLRPPARPRPPPRPHPRIPPHETSQIEIKTKTPDTFRCLASSSRQSRSQSDISSPSRSRLDLRLSPAISSPAVPSTNSRLPPVPGLPRCLRSTPGFRLAPISRAAVNKFPACTGPPSSALPSSSERLAPLIHLRSLRSTFLRLPPAINLLRPLQPTSDSHRVINLRWHPRLTSDLHRSFKSGFAFRTTPGLRRALDPSRSTFISGRLTAVSSVESTIGIGYLCMQVQNCHVM